jgi:PAS domain S-box-containing protein
VLAGVLPLSGGEGKQVAVNPATLEASVLDALFAEAGIARCLALEDGRIVRENAEWLRYAASVDPSSLPAEVPFRVATASELRIAGWARGRGPLRVPSHRAGPGPGPAWEGSLTWVREADLRMILVSLYETVRPSPRAQPDAERAIESALRLGEERLRKTLEYARAGVYEWDIVTGDVFWSPENFELYGVPLSERPSYGLWRSRVHPEDWERAERAVNDAVYGLAPVCEVEFRTLRPNGGVRWLYSRGEVRRGVGGLPLLMRGLNIDITPRKELELQLLTNQACLEESERRYRTLAEHAPDIVARFDRQFRYLYVNQRAEEAYGFTPEQLVGRSKAEMGFPPGEVELWHSVFEKVFATGEAQELEFTHSNGGEERHYEVRIAPELTDDGWVSSLVAVTRDVTAWKKAEFELRELDRQRSDFIAVLSHELRNPLAPIRNSLLVLDRTAPGTEAHTRAQEVLVRQTEQLSRLVDDLLDIGRLTHGKIVLQPTRLDARDVVHACCDAVRPLFEDRGVHLEEKECFEASWVDADRDRLAQMVGNLLNNALKFTPPAGQVAVRISAVNDQCEILVRDTGAGILPGDLRRIFEPFVQGSETGPGHGGMGVGLSLVKELATRHGGTVRVSSEGHGRGAEFVIALPRSQPPDTVQLQSPGLRPQPMGIFLVEDNEDSARSLADLLQLDGHRVEIFADPRAALDALQERQPTLLISDIGLPGMTGYELIRTIRRAERDTRLFTVAMTGYAQPQDRIRALEAGFDAHLNKPPSFEELLRVLVRASKVAAAPSGNGRKL